MNLALFDFDGTITDTDTFSSFVRFAVRRFVLGLLPLGPVIGCVIALDRRKSAAFASATS
jgi:hypothetical protein